MKTAADFRRAELRRKLRRADERFEFWLDKYSRATRTVAIRLAARQLLYWSDIARILRRTLREESTRRNG